MPHLRPRKKAAKKKRLRLKEEARNKKKNINVQYLSKPVSRQTAG